MSEDPLLSSLPKNLSIDGAQFSFPKPKPKEPSAEELDSDQMGQISSLVKDAVKSFKEAEKKTKEEQMQQEEKEKMEIEEQKRKEEEEFRKKNEFRIAGMPMALPERLVILHFFCFSSLNCFHS